MKPTVACREGHRSWQVELSSPAPSGFIQTPQIQGARVALVGERVKGWT